MKKILLLTSAKNKFAILACCLLQLPTAAFSQSPNYLWAKSAGGMFDDIGYSCTTDAGGNIIATGCFRISSITFGTTTLTNAGSLDLFIVKYDPNGNVLWAKSAGGTGEDIGYSCSADAGGNIIATGYFNSPTLSFGTTTLTNAGARDIFIVKYDPNGNVLWAKSAGGTNNDVGYSCSTDASGNIIVTGEFQSPSITLGTTTLTNAGNNDIFIVKYDPSGNVLWAKSAGGTNIDIGYSCSADASGNIITTGRFESTSITFGTTTLPNAGLDDIFIVKYDPSGNVLWAKSASGTGSDIGNSCSTDASGNIIATGYFSSSSITFGTTTLTNNAGSCDVFIVKYDPSGNVLWAKSEGGTGCDIGYSCSADASGNIIATGYFDSPSITFGTTTLWNANFADIFIVKYDPSGNVLWAKSAGGTRNDIGYSCSVDASGNIIATGYFYSPSITFGTTTLTNSDATGSTSDIFIVKLCQPPTVTVNAATICSGAFATLTANGASTYLWNTSATTSTISVSPASTTVYTVTGTTGGCNNAVTTTVTVNPLPTVSYTQNPNVFCVNSAAITLSPATPTGGTYSGTAVTGNAFNPATAGTGTFVITYSYTDVNACTQTTTQNIVVNSCIGINSLAGNNEQIVVYPNPSNGIFTIGLPVANAIADVYDLTGKKVANFILQSTTSQIDLNNLSNGFYFLNINTANGVYHKKINKTN